MYDGTLRPTSPSARMEALATHPVGPPCRRLGDPKAVNESAGGTSCSQHCVTAKGYHDAAAFVVLNNGSPKRLPV